MNQKAGSRYKLASGTQVREEDFGLLFYTMAGPRLYFLSSGDFLDPSFFEGDQSLNQWMEAKRSGPVPEDRLKGIMKVLGQLTDKGVIIEC